MSAGWICKKEKNEVKGEKGAQGVKSGHVCCYPHRKIGRVELGPENTASDDWDRESEKRDERENGNAEVGVGCCTEISIPKTI